MGKKTLSSCRTVRKLIRRSAQSWHEYMRSRRIHLSDIARFLTTPYMPFDDNLLQKEGIRRVAWIYLGGLSSGRKSRVGNRRWRNRTKNNRIFVRSFFIGARAAWNSYISCLCTKPSKCGVRDLRIAELFLSEWLGRKSTTGFDISLKSLNLWRCVLRAASYCCSTSEDNKLFSAWHGAGRLTLVLDALPHLVTSCAANRAQNVCWQRELIR